MNRLRTSIVTRSWIFVVLLAFAGQALSAGAHLSMMAVAGTAQSTPAAVLAGTSVSTPVATPITTSATSLTTTPITITSVTEKSDCHSGHRTVSDSADTTMNTSTPVTSGACCEGSCLMLECHTTGAILSTTVLINSVSTPTQESFITIATVIKRNTSLYRPPISA